MASRNILHKTKLNEFVKFMECEGFISVDTKGEWEIARLISIDDTVIVYTNGRKEHLSLMDKDIRYFRKFMDTKSKKTTAKNKSLKMIRETKDDIINNYLNLSHYDIENKLNCLISKVEAIEND